MSDDDLYAKIAAAQAAAATALQAKWGDLAKAFPASDRTHTVTAEDINASWSKSAESQSRSLGIKPLTDEENAKLKMDVEFAIAAKQAAKTQDLDTQLLNFRAERDAGRNNPSSPYYVSDGVEVVMNSATGKVESYSRRAKTEEMLRNVEAQMIEQRLRAGLPAEPTPRKTAAEIAQERYNASKS